MFTVLFVESSRIGIACVLCLLNTGKLGVVGVAAASFILKICCSSWQPHSIYCKCERFNVKCKHNNAQNGYWTWLTCGVRREFCLWVANVEWLTVALSTSVPSVSSASFSDLNYIIWLIPLTQTDPSDIANVISKSDVWGWVWPPCTLAACHQINFATD